MFRRNQVKTHRRLAREELNESYGHLRMAAAHAAGGAAGALAPRVDAARKVVAPGVSKARGKASGGMDSLFGTAKSSSRTATRLARQGRAKITRKKPSSSRRWPMIFGGLVAAGAAVGAASALMKRRNSVPEWDEYGATREGDSLMETTKNTMDAGIDKASAAAASAKDRTSDLIGSKSSAATTPAPPVTPVTSTTTDNMGRGDMARGDFKQQRDDMYGKPGATPSSTTTSVTGSSK